MTWPLSLSLSLLCRRDPKLACDETIETVDRLIEVLRRPPRLPFAVYVELDCWNWKPVDPKAADASDESVTGEDIEAAPGRHTAAADLVLDSTIITGSIKKGSPKSNGPNSPVDVPPLSFGVAATSAARAEAEAEATAAPLPTSCAPATEDAQDSSTSELAEDVYVPLDVLHSGPINSAAAALATAPASADADPQPQNAHRKHGAPEVAGAPTPAGAPTAEATVLSADEAEDKETERVRREEVTEQRAVANEPDPSKSAPLVHGRRVFSRLHPTASLAARANGGHVFLVQIEAPEEESGDDGGDDEVGEDGLKQPHKKASKGAACVPGELPLSCYTIYSSWSGRYTLQQWMENRPELLQMPPTSLDLWLDALKALINTKSWSPHAEELITFLFGAEMAEDSEVGSEADASSEDGGLMDLKDREAAKLEAAEVAEEEAAKAPSPDAAPSLPPVSVPKEATEVSKPTPKPVSPPKPPRLVSPKPVEDTTAVASPAVEAEQDYDKGSTASSSMGDDWVNPAEGWNVEYEDELMWELHFWARGYDRTQLEYNATVIEQLHKVCIRRANTSRARLSSSPLTKTCLLSLCTPRLPARTTSRSSPVSPSTSCRSSIGCRHGHCTAHRLGTAARATTTCRATLLRTRAARTRRTRRMRMSRTTSNLARRTSPP